MVNTKVAVLSDSHFPDSGTFPLRLLSELEKVDLIIHLGDICDIDTYRDLQKICPTIAVQGNMDMPELKSLLPEKKKIEINDFNLGLVHGWGPPKNLENRVFKIFEDVDIILFGHSHVPTSLTIEDVFIFNPGSVTMNRDGTGTYGILDLGETINHQIIRIDS
jgi:uncharacterized protein